MKNLFYRFPRSAVAIFSGWNLLWHAAAIVLTYAIVVTGFDWSYFEYFHNGETYTLLFPAVIVGGLFPIIIPVCLLIFGWARKSKSIILTGLAVGQAAIFGSLISSIYKAFTGRAHPLPFSATISDITHVFRFGFFRGGIFWGWPSSHTTIAFAMAMTLLILYPKNKILGALCVVYALYIGLGVSMSIHWFSDFVAGAIIGTIIGLTVGRAFLNKIKGAA